MIALSSINDPGYVSPSLGSHGRNPPGGARCLAQDSRGNRRSVVRSWVWWVNLTTHEAIRSNPNHVQHDVRYSYSKTYRRHRFKVSPPRWDTRLRKWFIYGERVTFEDREPLLVLTGLRRGGETGTAALCISSGFGGRKRFSLFEISRDFIFLKWT